MLNTILTYLFKPSSAQGIELILRCMVGYTMAFHGLGKLMDPESIIQFLTYMQIPFPHISAYLAGFTEFAGGIALLVGFMTRAVSAALAVTMMVAIYTLQEINGKFIFEAMEKGVEYQLTLLAIFVMFAIAGAGKTSVDAIIHKRLTEYR